MNEYSKLNDPSNKDSDETRSFDDAESLKEAYAIDKEDYEENFVVADMSGVGRQPILFPRFGTKDSGGAEGRRQTDDSTGTFDRGSSRISGGGGAPAREIGRDERRILIKGSILAVLTIAGVFALAFGIAIWLIGRL